MPPYTSVGPTLVSFSRLTTHRVPNIGALLGRYRIRHLSACVARPRPVSRGPYSGVCVCLAELAEESRYRGEHDTKSLHQPCTRLRRLRATPAARPVRGTRAERESQSGGDAPRGDAGCLLSERAPEAAGGVHMTPSTIFSTCTIAVSIGIASPALIDRVDVAQMSPLGRFLPAALLMKALFGF